MKRLTISMSDELFEKLDRIENKSLFIRKLLERELEMLDDVPDTGIRPWEQDITRLRGNVDELFSKLSEIEKHLTEKIVQGHNPESTIEILASGSLISYKNRPLPHIVNVDSEPIVIPLREETGRIPGTSIEASVPEILQNEMNMYETHEVVPEENEHNIMSQEEIKDLQNEEFTSPAIPTAITEPQLNHLTDQHTHETGFKEQATLTGEQLVMPDFKQQTVPGNMTTPFMQVSDQHVFPVSRPNPVMPTFNQHVIPISEPTQAMPESNQHFIPISDHNPVMPIFDQQANQITEHKLVMPLSDQPAIPVSEQETEIPEFMQQAAPVSEPPFVMPEFKSHAVAAQETEKSMPGLKSPFGDSMPDFKEPGIGTQINGPGIQDSPVPLTIPQFDTPVQAAGPREVNSPLFRLHEIPEPATPEKMPPFIAPSMPETQGSTQIPPFMDAQPAAVPSMQQPRQPVMDRTMNQPPGRNAKQGKLEGNILMYMPRGAKVKKNIIKSLVSKQFSDSEIEAKISELVSSGVLVLNTDNSEQYLVRP